MVEDGLACISHPLDLRRRHSDGPRDAPDLTHLLGCGGVGLVMVLRYGCGEKM